MGGVQAEQELGPLLLGEAEVAVGPQLLPGTDVALARLRVGVEASGRRLGRRPRLVDGPVPRGVESDQLLHPDGQAPLQLEGQGLVDVVLHVVEAASDLQLAAAGVDAGAGRLGDVDAGLARLRDQRDDVGLGAPTRHRMEVAALQLPVAFDALVGDPGVEGGDHRRLARPVLGRDRPLHGAEVRVGHADEPLARQRRLPAGGVAEAHDAPDGRAPDVQLVPVGEHPNPVQPEGLAVLDLELEDEPVGQVHQVLVEDRPAAQDGRLPVVATVGVGGGVVDAIDVRPLRRPTGAEVAVAGGGEGLAQSLLGRLEGLVDERPALHHRAPAFLGLTTPSSPIRSASQPRNRCTSSTPASR